jgi:hypothetical protein
MSKQINKTALISIIGSFLLSSLFVVTIAHAQDVENDWWFDVELIAFKRDLLPNQPEDFSQSSYVFSDEHPFDLFTLALLKQSNPLFRLHANLPSCTSVDEPLLINVAIDENMYTLDLPKTDIQEMPVLDSDTLAFIKAQKNILNTALTDNPRVFCADDAEYKMFTEVPQALFAKEPYAFGSHGLLADETKFLADYARTIFRQRDIQPLLYTAWRQPVVFGEDNAAFYRVFAGEKLLIEQQASAETDAVGELIEQIQEADGPSQADMILSKLSAMQQALVDKQAIEWSPKVEPDDEMSESSKISDVWELDGIFKVYLELVNRVPYLHIDSEFKHHRLALDTQGDAQIQVFPLKQRRRIISKQVHYFDHPAFGIIVRLERFEVPSTPIDEEQVIR